MPPRRATLALLLAAALLPAAAFAASTEKIIYSFTGAADGSAPDATLLALGGKLYGTASGAGETGGSVFAVTPAGAETTLATFSGGADGDFPSAHLVHAGSTLYGTTSGGGGTGCSGHDCGTVFSVPLAGGGSTVLYGFQGGTDGSQPVGGVVPLNGSFFGVTYSGGNPACSSHNGCGTVFKVSPSGKKTTLHMFGATGDGANPSGRLTAYKGALYGVTQYGGASNDGTIFKISIKGVVTILHSFTGADGAYPAGALTPMNGALYGAIPAQIAFGMPTYGSVFEMTSTFKTLYAFKGGSDGAGPNGDLLDNKGTLYGLTAYGGTGSCNNGCGTIFAISPSGVEKVLHSFVGQPDGGFPQGGLVKMNAHLYGVTYNGGTAMLPVGTVFSFQR